MASVGDRVAAGADSHERQVPGVPIEIASPLRRLGSARRQALYRVRRYGSVCC